MSNYRMIVILSMSGYIFSRSNKQTVFYLRAHVYNNMFFCEKLFQQFPGILFFCLNFHKKKKLWIMVKDIN